MRFVLFEDRELFISNSHKVARTGREILTDISVNMKKERQMLAKVAYSLTKNRNSTVRKMLVR